MGFMHDFGFGAPEDDPEAAKWYRLAAQGDSRVQIFMGFMYDFGYGVQEDDIEAVKWYRLAAEKGYTQANTSIYSLAEKGVPESFKNLLDTIISAKIR